MDSGKMDEFCNGDGMPCFMSVFLPLHMLLCCEFNWIKKTKLTQKKLFLRVCLGLFAEKCFSQSVFKLQGIQISEKLTRKIVLKANIRSISSTTSFLSES